MPFDLPQLPVSGVLAELADTLSEHDRVILQAPTGAGKTTLVPLYLLDTLTPFGKILMLEPRRIATSSTAYRMAELVGESVGQTVGYCMQLENRTSANTRIEIVTEGVLTRMLQADPELSDVSVIIFDEFHERSLQADLGLALTLQSQECFREEPLEPLKLLVMSATLQAEELSKALDAPVVTSEGFIFPVAIHYLPRPLADRSFYSICREVSDLIVKAVAGKSGSVLAFLPGAGEIRQVEKQLQERIQSDQTDILPLFGDMNLSQQRQAISKPEEGHRKIVLATNIAETSLTIEGIRIVVDSGLTRRAIYDPGMGMTRLETRRVTLSSADQRKGRAGRLEEGICYRLWTESEHQGLERAEVAEIAEADLAPLALELCNWGVSDPAELFWLTPPNKGRYQEALALLQQLDAIDKSLAGDWQITHEGQAMAALGAHPRIAHMLLTAADRGWLKTGCRLAAVLSERDLLAGQKGRSADLHHRLALFEGKVQANKDSLYRARQQAKRWEKRLQGKAAAAQPENSETIGRLLMCAYPDRIAQRRGSSNNYLLSSGQGAELSVEDALAAEEYLVIPALGGIASQRNARVFMACATDKAAIYDECLAGIEEIENIHWDAKTERVIAAREDRLGAIVLERQNLTNLSPDIIKQALLDGIRQSGLKCLPWDKESEQLRQRMAFLARFNAQMESSFPDCSEQGLLDSMESWLTPFLDGMTKLDHLKKLSLQDVLLNLLDWPQQQLLDKEAPPRWQAPSGSRIRVDYSKPEEPKISVRLQEIFGLLETPMIGFHQQPLTIELLSPAQRPVQITRDLASFWKNTYQEVKKDLKGRYPKHYWPDDPYTAQATHRVRPGN